MARYIDDRTAGRSALGIDRGGQHRLEHRLNPKAACQRCFRVRIGFGYAKVELLQEVRFGDVGQYADHEHTRTILAQLDDQSRRRSERSHRINDLVSQRVT